MSEDTIGQTPKRGATPTPSSVVAGTIAVDVLNRMLELGRLNYVRIA
jgi:hypothetical protein